MSVCFISQASFELCARLRAALVDHAEGPASIHRGAPESDDRPRTLFDRAVRRTPRRDHKLARLRFLSAAGTVNHAWWASKSHFGCAAMAVRALNSLLGLCSKLSMTRSRVRVPRRGECREAAAASLKVVVAMEAWDERLSLVSRHPGLSSHGLGWRGKARGGSQKALDDGIVFVVPTRLLSIVCLARFWLRVMC